MAKKGKMKISKVKRNNQTTNKMKKQGKLKLQRHRQKVQKHKQPTQTQPEYSSESESSSNEWADMLDEGEQQYIVNRLAKQPQLLSNVPEKDPEMKNSSKRKRGKEKIPKPKPANLEMNSESNSDSETNSEVEEKYEMEMAERPKKKLRPLLPIKTKDGVLERTEECEDSESEQEKEEVMKETNDVDDMESADSGVEDPEEPEPLEKEEVTTVELLAARRDRLRNDKLRIGALCSSLLESPEKKIKNLFPILYLMEEKLKDGTVNLISVRKLATLSAAEVFRDILPDYKIRHQDYSDIKLKKDTLALYKYEKELLEFYKRYLQRLEKAANVLRRKKGDNRKPDESSVSLALLSINCMCSVFTASPNFNYATNIAQSLIPLLGSSNQHARESVTQCCEEVFKEDNKGEITLTIVRLINQLVKRRGDRLHPSALDCLLSLKIRDVELDKEAEIQHKKKQDEKRKKRIVNLSKKEKKRAKKLKEVERELLETQAQESESARLKQLTEVTKTVFHIYFRLLKTAPRSGLLAAALNGLAKFTHVINLEYYSDLVAILSALLRDEAIGHRERLLCVRTVLSILSGAGDALNVDPAHFHSHLYTSALTVHAGASHADAKIIIEAAWQICSRARRVSPAVLRAFAKRLLTMAMQVQHNAALASLAVIHGLMQQNKTISSLFETDETVGSGRFDPTLPSPEHCNAHSATGYEACLLRRHYHPTVRDTAKAVLTQAGWPQELHKLTPNQIFNQYDGSQMAFKPSIPPPKTKEGKSKMSNNWAVQDFKEYCTGVEEAVNMEIHIK